MDNHTTIGRCLQFVKAGLARFIRVQFPDESVDDVANSLKLIAFRWNDIQPSLARKARALAHEMLDVRNDWAHQAPFSDDDTERALDTAERLLSEIGSPSEAADIKRLRKTSDAGMNTNDNNKPQVQKSMATENVTVRSADCASHCSNTLLRNIPFDIGDTDSLDKCLMERLASITDQVYGRSETKTGKLARRYAPLDFGWVNESRIEPINIDGRQYLQVVLHVGDTKEQGKVLFRLNPNGVQWPKAIYGYRMIVRPYIKIADAYSSALLWICPSPAESRDTHTRWFFETFAGRVQRGDWAAYGNRISKYIADWKNKCFVRDSEEPISWSEKLTETKRTQILASIGTNLRILIPYDECSHMDDDVENSQLAARCRAIIEELKRLIEKPVLNRMK